MQTNTRRLPTGLVLRLTAGAFLCLGVAVGVPLFLGAYREQIVDHLRMIGRETHAKPDPAPRPKSSAGYGSLIIPRSAFEQIGRAHV